MKEKQKDHLILINLNNLMNEIHLKKNLVLEVVFLIQEIMIKKIYKKLLKLIDNLNNNNFKKKLINL